MRLPKEIEDALRAVKPEYNGIIQVSRHSKGIRVEIERPEDGLSLAIILDARQALDFAEAFASELKAFLLSAIEPPPKGD